MEKVIELQKVEAFKTSDGKLFVDEQDAYKYEVEYNFLLEINKLLDKHDKLHFEVSYESLKSIREFIIEYKEQLKDIFLQL